MIMKFPVAPLRKIVEEVLFYREFWRKAEEAEKKSRKKGKSQDEH